MFRSTGYRSKSYSADIALGALDGVDSAIWSYAFVTIIFSGALSAFVPVGILTTLLGWALASVFVAMTSKLPTNMVSIDETSVVILGSIGALLAAQLGPLATPAGLATMLATLAITSATVAAGFFVVARLRIARLLELIPYPVVCGFMAGVAWLMLDVGVSVAVNTSISWELWTALGEENNLLKLAICIAGGGGLVWFTRRFDKAWILPAASAAFIAVFYAVTLVLGISTDTLVAGGWLFDIGTAGGGALKMLGMLSFADIRFDLILSVAPEIASIVFLLLLGNVVGMSVLSSVKFEAQLDTTRELQLVGAGNVACAVFCSPPACTDEVSSVVYEEFGASSRWMPITSSAVLLLVALVGTEWIAFMPTMLVGSIIFLFAFEMANDWMYENVRRFGIGDYAVVFTIVAIIVTVGFVEGVLVGVALAAFMFVLRYSMVSALYGSYTLQEHRSSVERPATRNLVLNRFGGEALVLELRGYLFFGTTNEIREALQKVIDAGSYRYILLDLRRATGIDVSALQTFLQMKRLCEASGILLLYACVPDKDLQRLLSRGAASERDGTPLVFPHTDLAVESLEEMILSEHAAGDAHEPVRRHLADLFEDERKASLILGLMQEVQIGAGEVLFRQNDPDDGFYLVDSGALTAEIETPSGERIRVKKFQAGSLIGELSRYTPGQTRTASVAADESSVLLHFAPASIAANGQASDELHAAVHELVARTLSSRIDFMNRRLVKEAS